MADWARDEGTLEWRPVEATRIDAMYARRLTAPNRSLITAEVPEPRPARGQVLLAVRACAVCRTDLHVVDGELPNPKLPLIPGHEIVGT